MGYLELPQVEVPQNRLKQEHLNTKNVYILDCYSDVFVWVGKKSTRLVRAAALKLSSELFSMLIRPEFSMIHRVSEGTESMVFRTKFQGMLNLLDLLSIAISYLKLYSTVATNINLHWPTWLVQKTVNRCKHQLVRFIVNRHFIS